MKNVTLEMVKEAWARFENIKNTAEQYMFPKIMFWDLKLAPLYNDLLEHWDDHHADIFMRGTNAMFISLGCPTIEV